MDGERFLNFCFFPKHETSHPQTIKPTKHIAERKYEDSKLNAECKVELCRLPEYLEKLYNSGKPIHLDSEKWQTKIARKKKQQRKKVPIEGTRRLFRQNDSDEDEEKYTKVDIDLNAPKKSSEFVAERSLNTPEGLRVLQRTTSSKENENIKSLIEFKENPIEEVTISSDEEENLESPPNCSLDADESNSNTAECNVPSLPTLSNLPATKDEEKELPEDTDEKLKNIVKRIKPNEKSTKLTTPKPLSSGRGKAKSFKPKKSNSIRNQLQKDPNLTSYSKSVKDANERNDSHSKCSSFQSVSTVGNKCHDSIPTHKPSFPTPVPVKVQQKKIESSL